MNTVVSQATASVAWRHLRPRWRYILKPGADGTLVREEWDPYPALVPWALIALGYPNRSRAGMRSTLERLDALVRS
jgi:hypothetical protein